METDGDQSLFMGGGGVGGSHGFKERQRDQSIFIEGGSEILFSRV